MEYPEPELITIIEGPPPEFVLSQEVWPQSMWEGSTPRSLAVCQMRTFSGPSMLERCTRAWHEGRPVRLDFPQMDGLRRQVDVIAARAENVPEGDVLYLWAAVPLVVQQAMTSDDAAADDEDDDDIDLSAFV